MFGLNGALLGIGYGLTAEARKRQEQELKQLPGPIRSTVLFGSPDDRRRRQVSAYASTVLGRGVQRTRRTVLTNLTNGN